MVKIFIDPGHGGKDSGAKGNGLQEKNVVLDIANRLEKMLQQYENVQVKLSRMDDRFIELSDRARMANAWGADYFVSIHINSGGGVGFESYIYTSRSTGSINAQNVVHNEIIKEIGGVDRGKKDANLSVLRNTSMPAILTETLFIDNESDAAKLKNGTILEKVAQGHANGIAKAFGLQKKEDDHVRNPPSSWAEPSWEKALKKGVLNDGVGPQEPLKREQLAVVLDRLGLLD